ncbi:MAG: hypothetical protein ACI8YO_002947 [Gammaproteobacteria bacterium]|jgi:hypothetical protein
MRILTFFAFFIFPTLVFSSLLRAHEFNSIPIDEFTPFVLADASYHLQVTKFENTSSFDCHELEKYCIGILTFRDGSIYNGEISYGKPHGKGIMKWNDSSYFIGSFLNGVRNGVGDFHFRNGNRYEGEWKNNRMSGQGTFIWANGTEYIGTFQEDEMHGTGSVVFNNSESYSGEWRNNIPNGQGSFTQNNGSTYMGSVKEGLRDGEGIILWENGDTIIGNWAAGKFDGYIRFQYKNGDQLISEWNDGQIVNQSSYISKKGKEIKGALQEIENALLYNSYDPAFASNIQFTYYSIGVEFETNNQYKTASEYLHLASNIQSDETLMNQSISFLLHEVNEKQKAN